jgi:hypothetical protein
MIQFDGRTDGLKDLSRTGTRCGEERTAVSGSAWPKRAHGPTCPPNPLAQPHPLRLHSKRVSMSPVCFSPHNQKGKKSAPGSRRQRESGAIPATRQLVNSMAFLDFSTDMAQIIMRENSAEDNLHRLTRTCPSQGWRVHHWQSTAWGRTPLPIAQLHVLNPTGSTLVSCSPPAPHGPLIENISKSSYPFSLPRAACRRSLGRPILGCHGNIGNCNKKRR